MNLYTEDKINKLRDAISKKGYISIGLTGGISTGKSNITRLLREHGYTVSDTDAISHGITDSDAAVRERLVSAFGRGILSESGAVNRKELGAAVFGNPEALARLNAILHPAILSASQRELEAAVARGEKIVFTDMPLLYEIGFENRFDAVWVVWIPAELQLERLMLRDGSDATAAGKRIASQLPIDEKKLRADALICSAGSFEETEAQLKELLKQTEQIAACEK